jgi:hypothetical protein
MKISNFSSSSQRKFFSHLSYSIFLLLNFFPIERNTCTLKKNFYLLFESAYFLNG